MPSQNTCAITMTQLNQAIAKEPELIRKDTKLNEVQLCCDWLATKQITSKIDKKGPNSYHYKHDVEAWAKDYISNSAFIAAVVILGIPYKSYPDYPNIYVAIK